MAEAVVQEEYHRRIFGNLHQQVAEAAHPVLAEHLDLVIRRGVALGLAVGGAEDAVPEQAHLLFQLVPGVDEPEGDVLRQASRVVAPFNEAPLGQVQVHAVVMFLRIEQLLNGCVVTLGRPGFKFAVLGAEPGPSHQMGHQCNVVVLVCH